MREKKGYRHTPAFILLSLLKEDCYGKGIMDKLQNELPSYKTDTAIIYRSLKELEKLECVESYWKTDTLGPAQKWYKITTNGKELLKKYREDIIERKRNFDYFLNLYDELQK